MIIAFFGPAFKSRQKEANVITMMLLSKFLISQGHQVYIITNRLKGLPKYEEVDGIKIYRPYSFFIKDVGMGINPFLFFNQVIAHVLGFFYVQKNESIKFDIIHSFSAAPILALRGVITKFFQRSTKVVHTIKSHSNYSLGAYKFSKVLNYVDVVSVQNEKTRKSIIEKGCRSDKIKLIRSHIDLNKFKKLGNVEKIKMNLGLKTGKVILYYGHLLDVKGITYLIEAVALLKKKRSDFKVLIAWSGLGDKIKYLKLIEKLGLNDSFKIIEGDHDIVTIINSADVVVLPYPELVSTEANPSCILESIACGVPVITSRLPELQELFEDNKEIILSEPKSPSSIADKINYVIGSDFDEERLTRKAYEKVDQFGVQKIGAEYVSVYKSII